MKRIAVAVAAALALSGCAAVGGGSGSDPFDDAQSGDQRVSIRVTNLNFSEATLWALGRSGRQRLGVVGGKADAVFSIDWPTSQPMRIEIDLLAGERCVTSPLDVDPGDRLELQIQIDLSRQPNCN